MISDDESEEGYYGGYRNDFHTQPKLSTSNQLEISQEDSSYSDIPMT